MTICKFRTFLLAGAGDLDKTYLDISSKRPQADPVVVVAGTRDPVADADQPFRYRAGYGKVFHDDASVDLLVLPVPYHHVERFASKVPDLYIDVLFS